MKLTIAFIIGLAGAAGLSAADAKAGQAAYQSACKMCHGENGAGNPAIAKALKVAIPDLGSKEVQGKDDQALQKVVTDGSGKMKPVKTVSGGQVADVIAFVRTLKK